MIQPGIYMEISPVPAATFLLPHSVAFG